MRQYSHTWLLLLLLMMMIQWKSIGTKMAYNEKPIVITDIMNFHMLCIVELFGNGECLSFNSSIIMSYLKVIASF